MAKRPSQRRLFRELAAKFGVEVAEAFMAAIRDLTRGVEFHRLEQAIRRGDLEDAIAALHINRGAFQPVEAKLVEAFTAGGQGAVATMPRRRVSAMKSWTCSHAFPASSRCCAA